MITPVIIVKSSRVTARKEFDAAETIIRPDRVVDVRFQKSAPASFIGMGLYAICAPLGKLDIPVPPGDAQLFSVRQCGSRGVAGAMIRTCGWPLGLVT